MAERNDRSGRRHRAAISGARRKPVITCGLTDVAVPDGLSESVLALAAIAAGAARTTDIHQGEGSVPLRGPAATVTQTHAAGFVSMGRDLGNPLDVLRCRIVWRLVAELFTMACERDLPEGVAQRRPRCHIRQIAMYLTHVVLSVPYRTIASAFGRDRTTVKHACAVVEDRRDDTGYDRFVERCERCIQAVFAPLGADHAER